VFLDCHEYDAEASDCDRSRDPLGADTTSAASLGAVFGPASGLALVTSPGGIEAAQPPVRAQGPHDRGERARAFTKPGWQHVRGFYLSEKYTYETVVAKFN